MNVYRRRVLGKAILTALATGASISPIGCASEGAGTPSLATQRSAEEGELLPDNGASCKWNDAQQRCLNKAMVACSRKDYIGDCGSVDAHTIEDLWQPLDGALKANKELAGANWNKLVVNWSGLKLRGLKLRGNFPMVNFSGADLTRASLSDAVLPSANFRGANLSHARLIDANLPAADFTGANVTQAAFDGAVAPFADFSTSKADDWVTFSRATLEGANFGWAAYKLADFKRANLNRSVFYRARIKGGTFEEAVMTDADLRKASFISDDADPTKAAENGPSLVRTNLRWATLCDMAGGLRKTTLTEGAQHSEIAAAVDYYKNRHMIYTPGFQCDYDMAKGLRPPRVPLTKDAGGAEEFNLADIKWNDWQNLKNRGVAIQLRGGEKGTDTNYCGVIRLGDNSILYKLGRGPESNHYYPVAKTPSSYGATGLWGICDDDPKISDLDKITVMALHIVPFGTVADLTINQGKSIWSKDVLIAASLDVAVLASAGSASLVKAERGLKTAKVLAITSVVTSSAGATWRAVEIFTDGSKQNAIGIAGNVGDIMLRMLIAGQSVKTLYAIRELQAVPALFKVKDFPPAVEPDIMYDAAHFPPSTARLAGTDSNFSREAANLANSLGTRAEQRGLGSSEVLTETAARRNEVAVRMAEENAAAYGALRTSNGERVMGAGGLPAGTTRTAREEAAELAIKTIGEGKTSTVLEVTTKNGDKVAGQELKIVETAGDIKFVSYVPPPATRAQKLTEDTTKRLDDLVARADAGTLPKQEFLNEFSKAMYSYYQAMPFDRGSAYIGRLLFATYYKRITGRRLAVPAESDTTAMVLCQADWVKFIKPKLTVPLAAAP